MAVRWCGAWSPVACKCLIWRWAVDRTAPAASYSARQSLSYTCSQSDQTGIVNSAVQYRGQLCACEKCEITESQDNNKRTVKTNTDIHENIRSPESAWIYVYMYHRPLKVRTDGGHPRVRELESIGLATLLCTHERVEIIHLHHLFTLSVALCV